MVCPQQAGRAATPAAPHPPPARGVAAIDSSSAPQQPRGAPTPVFSPCRDGGVVQVGPDLQQPLVGTGMHHHLQDMRDAVRCLPCGPKSRRRVFFQPLPCLASSSSDAAGDSCQGSDLGQRIIVKRRDTNPQQQDPRPRHRSQWMQSTPTGREGRAEGARDRGAGGEGGCGAQASKGAFPTRAQGFAARACIP